MTLATEPQGQSNSPSNSVIKARTVPTRRAVIPPLVAVFLLAIMIPAQIQVGPIRLSMILILMVITFIPLLFSLLSGRYGRLIPTDGLFALFVLWSVLALAINNPKQFVPTAGSTSLEFLGAYVLARVTIRTREDFVAFIKGAALAIILTLPFAVYETLTQRNIMLRIFDAIPGITTPPEMRPEIRMGLDRVQLNFGHAILYGVFCSLSVTMTLIGLRNTVSSAKRLAIVFLVLCGVFLSLSSGAILAVLFQIGLLTWNRVFARVNHRWLLLTIFLITAYVVVDMLSNRSPMRVFMSYATFDPQTAFYRSLILEWGMVNVWENPIFGLGLNDWVRPSFMVIASVDNFWLLVAMSYGIPAFLFVFIGYFFGVWQVAKSAFRSDPELADLRFAWVVTMVGLSLSLMTVHVWGAAYSYIAFLYGAGMWMVDVKSDGAGGDAIDPTLTNKDARAGRSVYSRFSVHADNVVNIKKDTSR